MNDFPETMPEKSAQWATLCYNRSPEFKVHSAKGLATSAIANKKPFDEIALYENKSGLWTKVWEYRFPNICECGRAHKETGDRYRRNIYRLDPDFEGTVKDAPVICGVCYKEKQELNRQAKEIERERTELARLKAKYDTDTATYEETQRYGRIGGLENLTAKD